MSLSCDVARSLAPDLALGALPGDDRAAVLEHIDGCPACAALVGDLASVVDNLLQLAPEVDPPPGFESAVLLRIRRHERAGRRRMWWVAGAAAAAIVVIGGVVAGTAAVTSRHSKPPYEALGATDLRAAPLMGANGKAWGQAFVMEGHTSWVFVDMAWDVPNGTYNVILDRATGGPLDLMPLSLSDGDGSAGHTVGTTSDVKDVRVVDSQGRTVCTARIPDEDT